MKCRKQWSQHENYLLKDFEKSKMSMDYYICAYFWVSTVCRSTGWFSVGCRWNCSSLQPHLCIPVRIRSSVRTCAGGRVPSLQNCRCSFWLQFLRSTFRVRLRPVEFYSRRTTWSKEASKRNLRRNKFDRKGFWRRRNGFYDFQNPNREWAKGANWWFRIGAKRRESTAWQDISIVCECILKAMWWRNTGPG